ncbi:MAG: hypothetical protein Ct9H90mP16_21790 [Candidatus Poseidoniales archaeon]|nr:MAG: hypothetical protein Ct9H90mP16_21790 [Candidatus Poseidoniales archaeon]
MSEDIVMRLLRQVKSGEVSLEDARFALEDVNLTEEEYITAVDHGVFNMPEAGTIVRSSISPSASTWLVTIVFVWGLFFGPSIGPEGWLTGYSTTGTSKCSFSSSR